MPSPLLAALALSVAQVPSPAPAQGMAELAWLQGSWRGPGTMFGQPSEARLEVRPTLGDRFLEFSYRAGGFEGRAFYQSVGEGHWTAAWFDNRGVSFPIAAVAAGQTLTSDWGSVETEQGSTVYRLRPDGRLEVTDRAGARIFASHLLTRE